MTIDFSKPINTSPVKQFFVQMLTRDIELEDAILDLLDNCVDGIHRSRNYDKSAEAPYSGFSAKIKFDSDYFTIEDNCGGIPWSEHTRAFRMGRPEDTPVNLQSVGVYGIGMKRAIFKLGAEAKISTQTEEGKYQVEFSDAWMKDKDNWDLAVKPGDFPLSENGTQITVTGLHEDIADKFSNDFESALMKKIATHYAVIFNKGFQVEVNGKLVKPSPFTVRFAPPPDNGDETGVRPYIFTGTEDDVIVTVIVGLREPVPSFDSVADEQEEMTYSKQDAGWTIICNDRVILYCDRSDLTGWGLYGIPRYHGQFKAIAGVVEFKGDPTKLPTTTTKRGLKFESPLYQQTLRRMTEGIRLFIDFTNKWKTMPAQAERIVSETRSLTYSEAKAQVTSGTERIPFTTPADSGIRGQQYKPKLPLPESTKTEIRITYSRSREEVFRLADKLFADGEIKEREIPREVGIRSFEFAYEKYVDSFQSE